jgi:hypothetical protein
MKADTDRPEERFGLLATGSCGRWVVDVDESDGGDYYLDLDGPTVYLVVRLSALSVLDRARRYLETPPSGGAEGIQLGQFGSAPVSLMWDNEEFARCFLIVSEAQCTLRVSLDEEDIRMLREALRQVVADLPVS